MINPPFAYSKTGLALTEQFEGLRLEAYQDQRGIWTCGYGHTGPDVRKGTVCSEAQATEWLIRDVRWAVEVVNRYVSVPISQDEFDGLVDFVFNVGSRHFIESSGLALLNGGKYEEAAAAFDYWDKVNGQVIAGLLRRRTAEMAPFARCPQCGKPLTSITSHQNAADALACPGRISFAAQDAAPRQVGV